MRDWRPDSWQHLPSPQTVTYGDAVALAATYKQLSLLPPLVTSWDVDRLRRQLAQAARGERFVLQAGDCAERFAECCSPLIANKLKLMMQVSLVLAWGLQRPVVRVGRIAGQYAKPRSSSHETREGETLLSYRGDLVNGPDFTRTEREPDPKRLVEGYSRAALTLNFMRSLADGGFADLRHPENWDLEFLRHSPHARSYREVVESVGDALSFMESVTGAHLNELERVELFASHEALHLIYEQAQTRVVGRDGGHYNLTTHLPWLGYRTSDPAGPHVEYLRGIRNPVAVKVGPDTAIEQLHRLLALLHPEDEPGRLTLIHRMGAREVERALPPLIEAVRASGKTVLWLCDPMHGNTRDSASGLKTRDFEQILAELERSFAIHEANGSHLGGVHLEVTGENVTECIGGARDLGADDLPLAYQTRVDPRLNGEQTLELALRIARRRR